jgi:hypothetical protein
VICWNAINHAIGWREILRNMRVYGAQDARHAIATDFFPAFVGHPGFDRGSFMQEIKQHFTIVDSRAGLGCELALLMESKQ